MLFLGFCFVNDSFPMISCCRTLSCFWSAQTTLIYSFLSLSVRGWGLLYLKVHFGVVVVDVDVVDMIDIVHQTSLKSDNDRISIFIMRCIFSFRDIY